MKPRLLIAAGFATALACGGAHAENLNFNYITPSFGGDPFIGSFLFGVAEAQRTATADTPSSNAGAGGTPGIGSPGNIGGPTIIIPITQGNPGNPVVNAGGETPTQARVQQVNP